MVIDPVWANCNNSHFRSFSNFYVLLFIPGIYYSSVTIHRLLFMILLFIVFYASFIFRDDIQKVTIHETLFIPEKNLSFTIHVNQVYGYQIRVTLGVQQRTQEKHSGMHYIDQDQTIFHQQHQLHGFMHGSHYYYIRIFIL